MYGSSSSRHAASRLLLPTKLSGPTHDGGGTHDGAHDRNRCGHRRQHDLWRAGERDPVPRVAVPHIDRRPEFADAEAVQLGDRDVEDDAPARRHEAEVAERQLKGSGGLEEHGEQRESGIARTDSVSARAFGKGPS